MCVCGGGACCSLYLQLEGMKDVSVSRCSLGTRSRVQVSATLWYQRTVRGLLPPNELLNYQRTGLGFMKCTVAFRGGRQRHKAIRAEQMSHSPQPTPKNTGLFQPKGP